MKILSNRIQIHNRLPLLFVFFLGLGLRIADYINKPCISRDSVYYIQSAASANLSDVGHGFWRLPYIYFLRLAGGIGADICTFGIVVNILCGAISGVLIMLIARRAAIPGAFWAGVYIATTPHLIKWSTEVQRETLFMLFVLVSIYVFFSYLDTGNLLFLVLSECFGFFAFMMRAEGVEVLLAIFLGVSAGARNTRQRRAWQDIAVAALALAILSLLYFVIITMLTNERPDIQLGKIIHSWKC